MRARDIMSSPVHTVEPTTAVEAAAELMGKYAVTALPVVDDKGHLLGMVSESDLLWHHVASDPTAHMRRYPDLDPADRPSVVSEVMSPYVVKTYPGADVAEVTESMLDHDVRSVPVLDDGVLVGIISRRDILRVMVRSDEVLTREVQHRLDEYAGDSPRWTATVEEGVARIAGTFSDDNEQAIVAILARTVPGVGGIDLESGPEATKRK
ncbi:CBS domain-containing protein [Actinoplanes sp. TBRC 11911]|uniref:CBS domain-containing protein n=1 Tax=Actinoplanes sp. TBRC 11911 TaxID=2729386 RepID=UPI00145D2B26|nr:CBS domain-containing protein [Actinoplanes sp. TBRC 11911]NMO57254.1 CBS domain-containing protein [Actinoplanes sp. TBRC 11911]